ncbi:MAG: hypothetical protein WB779_03090 [Ignavibacteriaceae bacterium]
MTEKRFLGLFAPFPEPLGKMPLAEMTQTILQDTERVKLQPRI